MLYWVLILFTFISSPVLAQTASNPTVSRQQDEAVLIKNITIEGFQLDNKEQFIKLFKPYRNKHLNKQDMDGLLDKIRKIYEEEGFGALVNIIYAVDKHHLIFSVSMTSQ